MQPNFQLAALELPSLCFFFFSPKKNRLLSRFLDAQATYTSPSRQRNYTLTPSMARMVKACSCRTRALRTFVRNVAQIHLPTENLARTPWHEIRRQAHTRTTTTWPAGPNLRYRTVHTAADSGTPVQDEDAHPASAEAEEQRPSQEMTSEPTIESGTSLHAESGVPLQGETAHLASAEVEQRPSQEMKSKSNLESDTPQHAESSTSIHDKDTHPASAEVEEQQHPSQEMKLESNFESDKPQPAAFDRPQPAKPDPQVTPAGDEVLFSLPNPQDTPTGDEALFSLPDPQDTTTGDEMLIPAKKRGPKMAQGNKKKLKLEAKAAGRIARLKAADERFAALFPEMHVTQSKFDSLFFDVPEEKEFSVEEVNIAEQHKTKQRTEKQTERRLKKKEEQKQKLEQERIERQKERRKNMPAWAVQKEALKKKFPDGWRPFKRLSPDALEGIRALNQQFPDMFPLEVLSQRFEVSPEAMRRILRSSWVPTSWEDEDRHRRWFNRGTAIWEKYEELGLKPPKRWRDAAAANNGPRRRFSDEERDDWGDMEEEQEDPAETERKQRMKTQRRLAQNLM